jgi:hypothetical protein
MERCSTNAIIEKNTGGFRISKLRSQQIVVESQHCAGFRWRRSLAFCFQIKSPPRSANGGTLPAIVQKFPPRWFSTKLPEALDASTFLKQVNSFSRTKSSDLQLPGSESRGRAMVSKCANPTCSTPFHYLREGKIFRVEVEVTPPLRANETVELSNGSKVPFLIASRKPARKLEHYWLCGPCSRTMSLLIDKDNGVTVMPKTHLRASAASAAS